MYVHILFPFHFAPSFSLFFFHVFLLRSDADFYGGGWLQFCWGFQGTHMGHGRGRLGSRGFLLGALVLGPPPPAHRVPPPHAAGSQQFAVHPGREAQARAVQGSPLPTPPLPAHGHGMGGPGRRRCLIGGLNNLKWWGGCHRTPPPPFIHSGVVRHPPLAVDPW